MQNLKKLKSTEGIFKQISIAHDQPRQRKVAQDLLKKTNAECESSLDKEKFKVHSGRCSLETTCNKNQKKFDDRYG